MNSFFPRVSSEVIGIDLIIIVTTVIMDEFHESLDEF